MHYRAVGQGPVLVLVSPGWGIGSRYLERGFAWLAPTLRRRLVFLDTRGSDGSGRPADSAKMSSLDMADDLEALRTHIGRLLPLYFWQPEKTLAAAQEQLGGPISSWAFRSQFAADDASGADQTQLLDRVKAEVLILEGRHDFICPLSVSERLHAGSAKYRLVVFEESGHLPWIEEPQRYFAELTSFFQQ